MEIIRTAEFEKLLKKLPKEIQRLYVTQERRFRFDWSDPRLHIKRVKELSRVFSFRITRRYRALFYFCNPHTAVFFEIDHRKETYR
jgi:mRNA-degrading endonuclease RelE of RelBE toxin-antitoxin system